MVNTLCLVIFFTMTKGMKMTKKTNMNSIEFSKYTERQLDRLSKKYSLPVETLVAALVDACHDQHFDWDVEFYSDFVVNIAPTLELPVTT